MAPSTLQTTEQLRYIWIIRHAKSADAKPRQTDHDRELNKRGERDGKRMQQWFADQKHPAQWVWCSSAVRAKLTASYVTSGFNATFVEQPELYLASADQALDCLQQTPAEISSVALVAHNPGLTYLVNKLSGEVVTDNLVTFGTALFVTDQAWVDLNFGGAKLVSLTSPKSL